MDVRILLLSPHTRGSRHTTAFRIDQDTAQHLQSTTVVLIAPVCGLSGVGVGKTAIIPPSARDGSELGQAGL